MNIFFAEKNPDKIVSSIKTAMGDRELSKIVNFAIEGKNLVVTISKMGTSTLTFAKTDKDGGCEFSLCAEKIGFAHKMFKDDVKEKIMKLVTKAGGKVK